MAATLKKEKCLKMPSFKVPQQRALNKPDPYVGVALRFINDGCNVKERKKFLIILVRLPAMQQLAVARRGDNHRGNYFPFFYLFCFSFSLQSAMKGRTCNVQES